jgi:ubiquinone/menaquinone biosynthesis C-methylase UbiE
MYHLKLAGHSISRFIESFRVNKKAFSDSPIWFLTIQIRKRNLKSICDYLSYYNIQGNILDIGTGNGYLPLLLAEHNENVSVIGIDTEKLLISKATRNAKTVPHKSRISYLVSDIHNLPFSNDYFSFILSTYSLHLWNDIDIAFKEIFRVLTPGGMAILVVGNRRLIRKLKRSKCHGTCSPISVIELKCKNTGFYNIDIKKYGGILFVSFQKANNST